MADHPQLLTGLHVLECTATVAGVYCGKLLADLGAEVVKLEPPEGDPVRRRGPFPNDLAHPERSGLFLSDLGEQQQSGGTVGRRGLAPQRRRQTTSHVLLARPSLRSAVA